MKTSTVLIGLAIGTIIYAPISMYVFDTSIGQMIDRTYFMFGGAAIALWCRRYQPS